MESAIAIAGYLLPQVLVAVIAHKMNLTHPVDGAMPNVSIPSLNGCVQT